MSDDYPVSLEEQDEKMIERIAETYATDYSEAAAEAVRTDGQAYVDDTGQPVAPSEATEYLAVWPAVTERPPMPCVIPIVHDAPEGYWIQIETGEPLDFYTNPMTGDLKGVPADD